MVDHWPALLEKSSSVKSAQLVHAFDISLHAVRRNKPSTAQLFCGCNKFYFEPRFCIAVSKITFRECAEISPSTDRQGCLCYFWLLTLAGPLATAHEYTGPFLQLLLIRCVRKVLESGQNDSLLGAMKFPFFYCFTICRSAPVRFCGSFCSAAIDLMRLVGPLCFPKWITAAPGYLLLFLRLMCGSF